MKRTWKILIVTAALLLTACPLPTPKKPPPDGVPVKVLMRYKFPPGRVGKYRVDEQVIGKFDMSLIPGVQTLKASSSMIISEKVAARPLSEGYASIERKIDSLRLKVWFNDKLTFDSTRFGEFSHRSEAEGFAKLQGKVIRFEMSELGTIRNIKGLGDLSFGRRPFQPSQMMETGNPTFSETKVALGDSWKTKREMPFEAEEKHSGIFEIEEVVTLSKLHRKEVRLLATLNLRREMSISLCDRESLRPLKGFEGEGVADGSFVFDVDRGMMLGGEVSTRLRVSTQVNTAPTRVATSMDLNSTTKFTLLEK